MVRQYHDAGRHRSIHCCLSAPLPQCITASVHCYLSALLPQCAAASVRCCLSALLPQYIAASVHCCLPLSLLSMLANTGIRLLNHYSHWHCSPSRRSFLTGRLPIHHGEQLSGDTTDDIDLRMNWISDRLASAGYPAACSTGTASDRCCCLAGTKRTGSVLPTSIALSGIPLGIRQHW